MLGLAWKVISGGRRGDWRSRLIATAQACVGFVVLLGIVAMVTLEPLWLLAFTAAQGLIVVSVVLFVVVAIFAQRTMVLEEFAPDEVIFREGEPGRHVYVVKSGLVDVLVRRPDGSEEAIKRLSAGDHFGEIALLRKAPRNATIRTVTATEVFKMSPGNFAALYTNLPGLREHFNKTMDARLREIELRK